MKRRASSRSPPPSTSSLSFERAAARHQALQLRHDLKEVADQAKVGDLEDRRLGVLVDGDDGARILDAGQMLDRAGYANRDIELRRNDLARLPDLHVVRGEAGIHRRA